MRRRVRRRTLCLLNLLSCFWAQASDFPGCQPDHFSRRCGVSLFISGEKERVPSLHEEKAPVLNLIEIGSGYCPIMCKLLFPHIRHQLTPFYL